MATELDLALKELKELREKFAALEKMIANAPVGTSYEADFECMFWTFMVDGYCPVMKGKYALVKLP